MNGPVLDRSLRAAISNGEVSKCPLRSRRALPQTVRNVAICRIALMFVHCANAWSTGARISSGRGADGGSTSWVRPESL